MESKMSYEAEWIVALIERRAHVTNGLAKEALEVNLRRWVRRLFDNA